MKPSPNMTKEHRLLKQLSLSNNSKFLDYNSAYMSVTLLITLTSSVAINTGISTGMPYMQFVSFKQSFLSMINSITVDLNGQSMIQQNQLIDIYNHFRLLTSESWTSQNRRSTLDFILMLLRLVASLLLIVNLPLQVILLITQN